MTELPPVVSNAIEDLGLEGHSLKRAQIDVAHYTQWVLERREEFPTKDDPVEHARMIDSYMLDLREEGYAKETIASRWLWVSNIYNEFSSSFLNHYAFLENNPIDLLKEKEGKSRSDYLPNESETSQKKRQYFIDKDELELLCDNLPAPQFRNETLLRLAWTSGLRESEICELKVDNVDLEGNVLKDFWVPKTADTRSLWIPETTVWYLEQYIRGGYRNSFSYAEESDYLFVTNSGSQMHRQRPNKILKEAADNAGIQEVLGEYQNGAKRSKVTFHALRRGHGMHLWQEGKDITLIRKRLGHESVTQTEEYLPISIEESKEELSDVTF